MIPALLMEEGVWLGSVGLVALDRSHERWGRMSRSEGYGMTAASGIHGPSRCCFPVDQIHQDMV